MYIICASQTVSKDHDFLIKCLDDGLLHTLTLSLPLSLILMMFIASLKSSSDSYEKRRCFAKASSNVELKCQRYLWLNSQGSQNMFLLHLNKRGRKNAIKLPTKMILIHFLYSMSLANIF